MPTIVDGIFFSMFFLIVAPWVISMICTLNRVASIAMSNELLIMYIEHLFKVMMLSALMNERRPNRKRTNSTNLRVARKLEA